MCVCVVVVVVGLLLFVTVNDHLTLALKAAEGKPIHYKRDRGGETENSQNRVWTEWVGGCGGEFWRVRETKGGEVREGEGRVPQGYRRMIIHC